VRLKPYAYCLKVSRLNLCYLNNRHHVPIPV
jgi:hypothetical protein